MRPFLRFLQDQSGGLAKAIEWMIADDLQDALTKALATITGGPHDFGAYDTEGYAAEIAKHPAMVAWVEHVTKERDEYKATLDRFNEALK